MDSETVFVTEVPSALKRLVRMVMRGFYTIEHVIVIDMLIRNPCMKEDDLVDLLQFERKQLRATIAQLKNDRFVKVRLRMETGPDGKATRQNYYYINYKVFVNVVKYKLDHMRRKIEMEERDSTSRASFKCTVCQKTFTDLEAGQLFDAPSGEFRCGYCSALVEEDSSALPRTDSRLLLAKFNEQIEPLYILLREVEDIRLSPEILEPEPTDVSALKRDNDPNKNRMNGGRGPGDHTTWSGDATRGRNFMMGQEQGITINISDASAAQEAPSQMERKERPIWMTESTVLTSAEQQTTEFSGRSESLDPLIQAAQNAAAPPPRMSSTSSGGSQLNANRSSHHSNSERGAGLGSGSGGGGSGSGGHHHNPQPEDIMEVLLAHERKSSGMGDNINDSLSSASMLQVEDMLGEKSHHHGGGGDTPINRGGGGPSSNQDVEEMESEDDDDNVATVTYGGGEQRVALHDVTAEHIAKMTPQEKDAYIKLSQEMYSNMYE